MRLRDIKITEEQLVAAKRHEIAVRYRNHAKRYRSKPLTFAAFRVAELSRIIAHRWGPGAMPDTDQCLTFARVVAHHLARLRNAERRISLFLSVKAPWLDLASHERLIRQAIERPLRWKADKLAWKLGITAAERAELKLRTIGATDQTAAERTEQARQRKRARDQARRKAKGSIARADYEAESLTRRQPWVALRMSRAKWYRAGKPQPF